MNESLAYERAEKEEARLAARSLAMHYENAKRGLRVLASAFHDVARDSGDADYIATYESVMESTVEPIIGRQKP